MKKVKKEIIPEKLLLNSYKEVVFSENVKKLIESYFEYTVERWTQTRFGKRKKEITASYIGKLRSKPLYYLSAGFLSRIEQKLKEAKIPYEIEEKGCKKYSAKFVPLNGITLRGNQPEIVDKALSVNRGIIHAYTAFGKTITAAALINSYLTKYPKSRAIFLAHTVDLIEQTAEELKKVLPFSVGIWKGKDKGDYRVVCVTRQTLGKMDKDEYGGKFLVVIRDECHKSGDEYQKLLYNLNCPVRYGITATLPNKHLEAMRLEGSVGPVVGTVTIAEGAEMGLLAVPEVNLIAYDNEAVSEERTYSGNYFDVITNNTKRNMAINWLSHYLSQIGESSLIFVREVLHGEILLGMFPEGDAYLVNGQTSREERMRVKRGLESKEIKIVICSSIWNEGISIKSLNNCIIAAGGKDDKMVMQIVGRGTRIDKGKDTVRIWDFLDPQKYMSSHSIERIGVYAKNKWKVNVIHNDDVEKYVKSLKMKNEGTARSVSGKRKASWTNCKKDS